MVCDKSVPEEDRLWITRTIRRCAKLWDCEVYEYRITVARLSVDAVVRVKVEKGARVVYVELDKTNLSDRGTSKVSLVHELLHVMDDPAWEALNDLASHIKDAGVRRRALRRARGKYENLHDRHAKLWARIIFREPRRRGNG